MHSIHTSIHIPLKLTCTEHQRDDSILTGRSNKPIGSRETVNMAPFDNNVRASPIERELADKRNR